MRARRRPSQTVCAGCAPLQVRREMAAEMGLGACAADIPPLPSFDGNAITPGTSFMARLSAHLRQFFKTKLESDPEWQHLLVGVPACLPCLNAPA